MKILLKSVLLISLVTLFACSNKQGNKSQENMTNQVTEQSEQKFGIESSEVKFKMVNLEKIIQTGGIMTHWILDRTSEKEPFMFYVAQNPFPEKLKEVIAVDPKELDGFFMGMLSSTAIDLGGTDLSFHKIKYDKYDGMESSSTSKMFGDYDGIIIKNRVFLIGENTFLILACGDKSKMNIIDEFISSFVFKGEKTAANGRFGASGGVTRPTVCTDFQPVAPVRVAVETPACRQAAATLAATRERQCDILRNKEYDKTNE